MPLSCRAKSKAMQSFLVSNSRLNLGFYFLLDNYKCFILIHACLHPQDFLVCFVSILKIKQQQQLQGYVCIALNLLDCGVDLNDYKQNSGH